jgi:hypothetical protein
MVVLSKVSDGLFFASFLILGGFVFFCMYACFGYMDSTGNEFNVFTVGLSDCLDVVAPVWICDLHYMYGNYAS